MKDDFSKQKIVWGNLGLSAGFAAAPEKMFVNAPCPMIVPFNKFLLFVLNSKLGDWYIRQLGVTRNGGYFEYKPMFVQELPVPQISSEQEKAIILQLENAEDNRTIDEIIFSLYGLDKKEKNFLIHSSVD